MSQPKRLNPDSSKSTTTTKPRRSFRKDVSNLYKDGLNWDKYLQICNLPAAPQECFTQTQRNKLVNKFEINDKLEAQDPRSPTSICLATVVSLQGPRIQIRLDGGDNCNDFWRLVDAGDIYPLGSHEAHGKLLQPPLGYTRNMSTWSSFLAKNREKGEKAGDECFLKEPQTPDTNLFELGMKLEAIDRKNPDLICPATIGDIDKEKVLVSFDGWRGAMDYWCHYNSRELFPAEWCYANDHPLTSPGNKGDNPAVVERLKQLAEMSKRQTRSGAGTDTEKISRKSPDITVQVKSESIVTPKSGRGRGRTRLSRTPATTKTPSLQEKTPVADDFTKARLQPGEISSVVESSVESETCDSSLSSQQTSESSSSEEETENTPKKGDVVKTPESTEGEDPIVEIKGNKISESVSEEISDDERKRHERKLKKKKKNKKKLKKLYQLEETNLDVHEEKRYASLADEEHYVIRSKKRKKNKRKHSMSSSLHESQRKRIVGFGTQSSANLGDSNHSSIQSPSFLDHATSPTSLFGFSRDEIVKKATEGWPSRVMGNSQMVVTSDNKLGRFGSENISDDLCQTAEDGTILKMEALESENNTHVTTTMQIDDRKSITKQPDSTTKEYLMKISSQTVSSTTNPSHNIPQRTSSQNSQTDENSNSTPRLRSRNPQRWSVADVVNYIRESEPALQSHIHLFKIHEIDGQALLLLNSTLAVKYMNMKLGPALKLSNIIEQLKDLVPPQRGLAR